MHKLIDAGDPILAEALRQSSVATRVPAP